MSGWGPSEPSKSGYWAEKADEKKPEKPKQKALTIKKSKLDDVGRWLMETESPAGTACVLLYGEDGTGKTGLIQDSPLRGDGRMIIFDMDGSNSPIKEAYHSRNPDLIIKDPTIFHYDDDEKYTINYIETMNRIKAGLVWIKDNYQEHNITCVVLDGLNKLLQYAEYQMRIESGLQSDGGVSTKYWIKRSKAFTEIIEIMKGLPINKIYSAHEDFVMYPGKTYALGLPQNKTGDKMANVKINTNQLMNTKVFLRKDVQAEKTEFKAVIHKHKSNSRFEMKEFTFLTVPKDGNPIWNSKELWEAIAWRPN